MLCWNILHQCFGESDFVHPVVSACIHSFYIHAFLEFICKVLSVPLSELLFWGLFQAALIIQRLPL